MQHKQFISVVIGLLLNIATLYKVTVLYLLVGIFYYSYGLFIGSHFPLYFMIFIIHLLC